MSIQHLLRELFDRGIKLAIKGDQLQIQAPKGALDAELRDRLAANKSSILAMLRDGPIDARSEVHAVVVPAPDKRHEPFPLTDIQRAYWLGRTGAFTIPSGIHYYREYDCVDLDIDRLRRAFQKVVARHDMLRAHTLPDMLQVIEADVSVDIEVRDLRNLEPAERLANLESMRETMAHRIYDTSQLPLHHVVAVRLDEQITRLVVSIDLINVDGGSLAILFNDWMRFYTAPELSLPPLEFSYRDYVFALDANRKTPSYQRSLDYWRNRIKDLAPAPVLPIAKDPATLELIRFEHLEAHLDLATWEKLQARARVAGMTTAIVFITAYAEAISRFSANSRFSLNVTLFNRLPVHPEVDEIIGDFSSMLLLSVDSGQTLSFTQKAQQIQTQLWEAMEHRQVSGIEVQREVARVWDEHRGALFPVVFTSLQNQRTGGLDALAQIGKLNYQITQTPQLLIDHQLCERVGDAVILWDVVKGVYPDGLVENMFEVYTTLLRRLAHDDNAWNTNQLDLLPAKQRMRLDALNAPAGGSLPEELIHTSFERRVDETPEKFAVITSRRVLTYADVDRRANVVAHHLRARGIGPDKLVPIVMEKGWEQVVAIFAVLKAGGAYVPLDVGGSEERLRGIIEDSGARVVLTQSKYTSEPWGRGIELLAVDDDTFAAGSQERLSPVQHPDHLAFVLYTSGSTGQPKGAMIELRGLIHRLWETAERFGLERSDIALGLTGLHHDLSVFDVCGVLGIIGGTLVLPDADKTRDPAHWISLIEAHRVTLWNSVPAFMQMLVEYADERPEMAAKIRSLRWAIWGGDFIPLDLPHRVRALVPHIALNSSGGPTETTLWNICYPIEAVDPAWKSIPYGRPMRAATYHIFDEQLRERPDWVPGEMYIGGLGLARGYWHDEPKTRERFIVHPVTGERLYKSGDLGRWLPDGNIEILGRADFQVKIRGYRIELGEVEAAVQAHPSVKQAVVLAIGTNAKDKRLCAYVVCETQARQGAADAPKLLLDEADKVAFKLARHGLRQDLAAARTIAFGKIAPDETLLERYARRRSIRTFLDKPVQIGDLGRFLSVLAPITPPGTILPKYLYPSGGSLYPVQTYVYVKPGRIAGIASGFYYYDPVENALRLLSDKPLEDSAHVSWNLEIFEQAAFVLLFVGKRAAVEPLYGPMARDFCVLEAGYMGQLLMEQAPTLGLGVCPLGYVDFAQLRSVLGVDDSSFFAHGMFGGCAEPAQFAAATLATESVPAPKAKATVFSDELRPFLQKKLPEYMIPTAFVELDALPLTANGKVDRKALLALEPTVSAPPTNEPTAPANELETNILAVISEVVGAPNIRVEQNFFDAGATSLHIVIIAKRLREKLELDVPVTLLFQASNVRALAVALASSNPHAVAVDKAQERGEARRKARLRR